MDEPTDSHHWRRADELFTAALELPAEHRRRFLSERCSDDERLLREVEALLRAGAEAGDFLDESGGGAVANALVDALGEADPGGRDANRSGSRLGPYLLIAPIDRGGMADVYLAERADGAFEQRVAIKIQRRGLDTDDMLARFRTERQILSGLSHPNIARLLDGGATDDGLPYLVMEYVEGIPITRYCEEHRLSVPARLRLFLQVARAVQGAHAQLVVHRDIKPSNVLVTAAGDAKLLDFGIAKLLDPDAWPGTVPRTRTGFRPLTPEYASPEQVRGDPITTASDIYQLGLLLYRILTGGRPFEAGGRGQKMLEDAITEARPTRPSDFVETRGALTTTGLERRVLVRWLRGDLDTIVLAALRKEPDRRYASAHEMAEDVRRHLEGRPIAARQESRVYRVGKFVRRNPWAAPAAAVVVLAVGAYIGTLIRHGEQLELERNTARLEAERARTSQDFLVGLFRSADPFSAVPASRRDIRVSDVMEEGVLRARSELADRPEIRSMLLGTIGDVFLGLGDPARAVDLRTEALEIARQTFGPESPEVAAAMRELAEPTLQFERRSAGRANSAVLIALRSLGLARSNFGTTHTEALRAQVTLGHMLLYGDALLAAEPILEHAIGLLRDRPDADGLLIAEALMILARARHSTSRERQPEAEAPAREAVELLAEELGDGHVRVLAARVWLGSVMQDPPAAIEVISDAWIALDSLLGPDHELAIRAAFAVGEQLWQAGRSAEAADVFDVVATRRARRDGARGFWYEISRRKYADAALRAGRYGEAIAAYDELMALAPTEGPRHGLRQSWALVGLGRADEALHGLQLIRQQTSHLPGAVRAEVDCVAGHTLRALGRTDESDQAFVGATTLLAAENYVPPADHLCWGIVPNSPQ